MLRRNESMAWHTSFRIGGKADFYATVEDVTELACALSFAWERDLPVFILGGGSNILVSDGGIRGLTIENRMQSICVGGDGNVQVSSGLPLSSLVRMAARRGLAGLEWAAGIPGTVGGAIVGNAGAYGRCMADLVRWVGVLSEEGTELILCGQELGLGYRHSRFKKNGVKKATEIILEAELVLQPTDPTEVQGRLKECAQLRRRSQPLGPNTGSIFKNPPGDYAGSLIERAGLKGYRVGDVQISPKHANFFINLGQGRASDVAHLVSLARKRVLEEFGIWLDLEIEMVGEWDL